MPTSLNDSVEWTTNAGTPVVDNDHSLTVGQRGPVLLEDYHLLEKLAQFDRERIPERVVHARGMSAKGYFEVCEDAIPANAPEWRVCAVPCRHGVCAFTCSAAVTRSLSIVSASARCGMHACAWNCMASEI